MDAVATQPASVGLLQDRGVCRQTPGSRLLQPRGCGGHPACLSGAAPGQRGLQTPGSRLLQPRGCGVQTACLSGAAPEQGGLQTPGSSAPVLGFSLDPIASAFDASRFQVPRQVAADPVLRSFRRCSHLILKGVLFSAFKISTWSCVLRTQSHQRRGDVMVLEGRRPVSHEEAASR